MKKIKESANLKPKALSLFTGAGGLDIGFHQAGFEIVACVEIESVFCKTLEKNKEKHFSEKCQVINQNIRDIDPASLNIGSIDVIIGGPPCQSFSAAGRRAGGVSGVLDERGSLFEHYGRFVNYFKPKVFIFENVRGILQANKGKDWQEILEEFRPLNYLLFYKVLDAADYGVPQHRERLILVGVKQGDFLFPKPTHGADSLEQHPYMTAGEAISDLQVKNELIGDYGGKYGELLRLIPPGMNYLYFTKEMGYPNPVFAWRSRFSDFLYKADPNKPVKTIVAKLGRYSGPFHWQGRKFTLAEMKRLQSFPDDYAFAGTLAQQLQQIGNSVAPKFAEALALAVQKQFFNTSTRVDLIPTDFQLSFDKRKRIRAKETRGIHVKSNESLKKSGQLFNSKNSSSTFVKYFLYSSSRHRTEIKQSALANGAYEFDFKQNCSQIFISVSKFKDGEFVKSPLLQYELDFNSPIGDGIKQIVCSIRSDKGEDIPIAWDAVEMALRRFSNYHSLMDIYGHFTEPHPIFDLECLPDGSKLDAVARFAHFFSEFENTTRIFPANELGNIMRYKEPIEFLETVKMLRKLRFDVRVHETNVTIPQKMFRCTYPFSLGYEKQVSISWKDKSNSENIGLMV